MVILGDPGAVSREKRRDESFQAQAEEPLGTDSHRTISKRSSECWLLIGHKKCFVLLCPIGEQHLLQILLIYVFGVGRQDPARKRKVSIILYCSVSYFLLGIYVSDKTRNCCELGNLLLICISR